MVNIGVVGVGSWGPNLVRNFHQLAGSHVVGICDINRERLEIMGAIYRSITYTEDMRQLLDNPDVHAMAIATSAKTHYALAKQCLEAGKHCFVEKPLALTVSESEELIAVAAEKGLILMVGHTFLYNKAVVKVKELIKEKELGDILYVYCQRLNLGKVRDDLDVVWNLAPHDISILCYWFDILPSRVRAKGYPYLQSNIADVAFITLDFPNNIGTHIHVSWLDPNKVRTITVVGSKKMLVYNDISLDRKITIYDKGAVSTVKGIRKKGLPLHVSYDDFKIELRDGDITIPYMRVHEPLRQECKEFIECIQSKKKPLSDGKNGLDVVRVLQACTSSMSHDGTMQVI